MTSVSSQNTSASKIAELPMLTATPWQMTYGERVALEGILAQLQPVLAIEIGTAEGGSLARVAAHSAEVHSFDLVDPQLPVAELPHVHIHAGDNHELLPQFLSDLEADGRSVDFVLVDGDHSADGVERDILDLLRSDAVTNCVIVLHDTINEEVRRGIDRIDYAAFEKVRVYDLDAVPGTMSIHDNYRGQLWGGMGIIVCSDQDVVPHLGSPIVRNCVSPTRVGLAARSIAGYEVERETDFVALHDSLAVQAGERPSEPEGLRAALRELRRVLHTVAQRARASVVYRARRLAKR